MCGARYLVSAVNTLSLLVGLALFAFSIYVIAAHSYLSQLFSVNAIYGSLVVGAVLMFLGCFGCYSSMAADRGIKTFISCHVVLILACIGAQTAIIVIFYQLGGTFNTLLATPSNQLTVEGDITLNNALLSTYTQCCVTADYCKVLGVPTCIPVLPCVGGEQDACMKNQITANEIDQGLCNTLSQLGLPDQPKLVGPRTEQSCGNGLPGNFMDNTLEYFLVQLNYIHIAMFVFLGVQVLNFFAAVAVCCARGRNMNK